MKKVNQQILNEIIGNLRHFFNESETISIQSMLINKQENSVTKDAAENGSDIGNKGYSLRFEIDRILTFAESGLETESFQKLTLALSETLVYKGEYDIAEEILENTFNDDSELNSSAAAAIDLIKAKIAWYFSDWESAKRGCIRALKNYLKTDDLKGMATCENLLGNISGETGDLVNADRHYNNGLRYIQNTNLYELKAMLTTNLGVLADMKGRISFSEEYYKSALELYTKLDNDYQITRLNHNLGMLCIKKKNYQKAIEYFDKSINLSVTNGHLSNYSISLIGKATSFMNLAKLDEANTYADKAFEVAFSINDRLTIAEVYRIKGLIQSRISEHDLAEEYLNMSIRINENFKSEFNLAESSLNLSEIYYALNRKEKADKLSEKVSKYYKDQGIRTNKPDGN